MNFLIAIANPSKSEDKCFEKVFNWSEVHLSEMTCYQIHTLVILYICIYLSSALHLTLATSIRNLVTSTCPSAAEICRA